jgi:hypothetical protein
MWYTIECGCFSLSGVDVPVPVAHGQRIQSNDEGLNELNCGCDCIPPPARCHPPVAAPVPCHPSVVIGRRIVDPPSNNVSTDHHTFDSRLSFLIPSILTSGYQLIRSDLAPCSIQVAFFARALRCTSSWLEFHFLFHAPSLLHALDRIIH